MDENVHESEAQQPKSGHVKKLITLFEVQRRESVGAPVRVEPPSAEQKKKITERLVSTLASEGPTSRVVELMESAWQLRDRAMRDLLNLQRLPAIQSTEARISAERDQQLAEETLKLLAAQFGVELDESFEPVSVRPRSTGQQQRFTQA